MKRRHFTALAGAALLASASLAAAQDNPLRVWVGFPPGGSVDTVARLDGMVWVTGLSFASPRGPAEEHATTHDRCPVVNARRPTREVSACTHGRECTAGRSSDSWAFRLTPGSYWPSLPKPGGSVLVSRRD